MTLAQFQNTPSKSFTRTVSLTKSANKLVGTGSASAQPRPINSAASMSALASASTAVASALRGLPQRRRQQPAHTTAPNAFLSSLPVTLEKKTVEGIGRLNAQNRSKFNSLIRFALLNGKFPLPPRNNFNFFSGNQNRKNPMYRQRYNTFKNKFNNPNKVRRAVGSRKHANLVHGARTIPTNTLWKNINKINSANLSESNLRAALFLFERILKYRILDLKNLNYARRRNPNNLTLQKRVANHIYPIAKTLRVIKRLREKGPNPIGNKRITELPAGYKVKFIKS